MQDSTTVAEQTLGTGFWGAVVVVVIVVVMMVVFLNRPQTDYRQPPRRTGSSRRSVGDDRSGPLK